MYLQGEEEKFSEQGLNELLQAKISRTGVRRTNVKFSGYFSSDKFPPFHHFTIIKSISQLNVRHTFQASYASTLAPTYHKLDSRSSVQVSRTLDARLIFRIFPRPIIISDHIAWSGNGYEAPCLGIL